MPALDLAATEEDLGKVGSATLLSLVGLQARALAEEEEHDARRLFDDLLELKLKRLELKVREKEGCESRSTCCGCRSEALSGSDGVGPMIDCRPHNWTSWRSCLTPSGRPCSTRGRTSSSRKRKGWSRACEGRSKGVQR